MRSWPHAVAAAVASLTLACGEDAAVISIGGDLSIPAELDGMCLSIADGNDSGGEFARFYRLGDTIAALPQTLTVEPGSADRGVARVRGYLGGVEVARDRRGFDFGGITDVDLDLDRCPGGDRGSPEVAGSAALPDGARVAVSLGRGGPMVLVVGASAAAAYRADDGLEGLTVALPVAPASAPVVLLAFDADADCDDDLLVVLPDAPPVLWRRDGRDFAESDGLGGAGLAVERAAAAADVDGDGDLDLAIGRGAVLRLLRNDGTGRFQADGAAIPGGAVTDVTALAFGDIDGDGNVDLVVGQGDESGAPARVLLNDASGSGNFERQDAALPELPLRTRALAIADVNRDGAVDLVVGAVAASVRLYINRGDGRLEDRSFVTLPNMDIVDAQAVSAADWDADCLPDIAVAATGGLRSWRGSDTGEFVDEAMPAGGDQLVLSDVDDDGDRDLIVAGAGEVVWVRR